MKIIYTLKEFELLSKRCPYSNYYISEKEFIELIDKCIDHCPLYSFCKYNDDDVEIADNWSLADLVKIVPPEGVR